MNHNAIETGIKEVKKVSVPKEWTQIKDDAVAKQAIGGRPEIRDYIDNVLTPINAQQGDKLPVS
ncbi:MAG TPA: hypothetical protein DEB10_12455, partial [Ruminococcaceae bacterium]|nr:hypothetical protein [Oscillospiraceae bacterium]